MKQELSEQASLHCTNCGSPLQGVFCHDCGQSIHSVLKPLHGMAEDALDLVLNVDSRIVHTLPPLFLRPGYLTLEYFAGRRMRYLAPFRLMFVLCLLALFVLQLAMDNGAMDMTVNVSGKSFEHARTPAEVDRLLHKQLRELEPTRQMPVIGALASKDLDAARLQLVRQAAQRRLQLGDITAVVPDKVEELPKLATNQPADSRPPSESEQRNPFDRHWDMQKYPITVGGLPDFLNQRLNRAVVHARDNLQALQGDGNDPAAARERLVGQVFSILPMSMFFMLPVFAALLKVIYLFRRRLYMEHLIVALHSHAFMFLSLLLGALLYLLKSSLATHLSWIGGAVGVLLAALWIWSPIYLLLMQKRIYKQGWFMTSLKYLLVSWCYCWLLAFALLIAFAIGLAS